jgi:hypothetical protein
MDHDDPQQLDRAMTAAERGLVILLGTIAVALLALWVVRWGAWRTDDLQQTHYQPGPYANRIDPNTAGVDSLARLPGIGPTRAGQIVAYRERFAAEHDGAPAFTRPEDLAVIKGIGPKTVAKLAPYLAFPSASSQPAAQPN